MAAVLASLVATTPASAEVAPAPTASTPSPGLPSTAAQPGSPSPSTPAPSALPSSAPAPSAAPSLVPPGGSALPPGVHVVSEPNGLLAGAGITMLGSAYGTAAGTGLIYLALVYPLVAAFTKYDSPEPALTWLLVPVVGPFFSARTHAVQVTEPGLKVPLYIDGAAQVAGLALLIAGLAIRTDTIVYDRALTTKARRRSRWALLPAAGAGPGLTLALSYE